MRDWYALPSYLTVALLLSGCASDPDMVRITPGSLFAVQRTEVTRGDYARFARATRRVTGGGCSFLADPRTNRWATDRAHDWRRPGFAQTARHPVVCVDLADAQAYAAWLSERTGRRLRLPRGDEWEHAARAGTTTARWWGEALPCAYANVADRTLVRMQGGTPDPAKTFACDDGFAATAPVASFAANPFGLHDILGNVWEWTLDCTDAACASHVDRGGSWVNSPRYLSAAVRHPELTGARTTVLGFRLVEDLP